MVAPNTLRWKVLRWNPGDRTNPRGADVSDRLIDRAAANGMLSQLEAWLDFWENQENSDSIACQKRN